MRKLSFLLLGAHFILHTVCVWDWAAAGHMCSVLDDGFTFTASHSPATWACIFGIGRVRRGFAHQAHSRLRTAAFLVLVLPVFGSVGGAPTLTLRGSRAWSVSLSGIPFFFVVTAAEYFWAFILLRGYSSLVVVHYSHLWAGLDIRQHCARSVVTGFLRSARGWVFLTFHVSSH